MSSPSSPEPEEPTPFLLKVFCRTGTSHRPDEFTSSSLPPHIPIYTWKSCTLSELARHIAAASPSSLPDPAIGTRLVFRIIFADPRGRPDQPPRFTIKDIGSLVIGEDEKEGGGLDGPGDGTKTLNDARFIVGDYVSCAILPPSELTGEVVPSSAIRGGRMGRGGSFGDGDRRSAIGVVPPPRRDQGVWGRGSGGRGDSDRGYGGRDRDRRGRGGGASFPDGEWRRGERLPEPPMGSGRGPR